MFKSILSLVAVLSTSLIFANDYFSAVEENQIPNNGKQWIQSENYATYYFNINSLRAELANAPKEFSGSSIKLAFPTWDGKVQHFNIVETKTMEDGLAEKYPQFKTYSGQGVEEPTSVMKLDVTHKGLHVYVRGQQGTWAIDPYHNNTTEFYLVHHKNGFITDKYETISCELTQNSNTDFTAQQKILPECVLRTYRIAINATGEFTAFHGGTVADGLAAVVTALNRINGVYETDAALRMILIDDNDEVIYTNSATDPFNNNSASSLINASHQNLVNVFGNAAFDIGHVFATGGSGLANLGATCSNNNKGRGTTGVFPPVGDFFDIDYASHELGHQWGGNHTWDYCSGGGNGGAATMEPGSASTIMGYAGLCGGNNLQNNSDAYFHAYSILEMTNYSQLSSGNNCAQTLQTDNTAPTVIAGDNHTIPANTPFELFGDGFDADGDALTYCWEQFDTGNGDPVNNPSQFSPLFRTWFPTTDNFRIFPRIEDLVNNTTTFGETLPEVSRNMNFRLTVRDNVAGGGCTNFDDMIVTVDGNSGPFLVTAPNGGEVWAAASVRTINWNPAQTNSSPIFATNVDIFLSEDGGFTYPYVVAANVANSGTWSGQMPNVQTQNARIKIKAKGNIFFDISNEDFVMDAPQGPIVAAAAQSDTICQGESVELYASGADNYIWYPSSSLSSANGDTVLAFPTATTTYNLTGIASNGNNSTEITIVVIPHPGLAFQNLPTVYQNEDNSPILLEATPAGGTFTVNGNPATELDPWITGAGDVTVTYSYFDAASNCTFSISQNVFIDNASSTFDAAGNNINFYIQNDFVFLNNSFEKLSIINIEGKIVATSSNSNAISLNQLSKGIYILKIDSENISKAIKFSY